MYKVYGIFVIVPGLDLGTSDLEPNTAAKSSLSCVHSVIQISQLQFAIAISNLLSCENTLYIWEVYILMFVFMSECMYIGQ